MAVGNLFLAAARILLLITLVLAPWLIGSFPAYWQGWIAVGLAASSVCLVVASLATPRMLTIATQPVSWLVVAGAALAGLAGLQLSVQRPETRPGTEWSRMLAQAEPAAEWDESVRPISIVPSMTRFQLLRVLLVLGAVLLGTCLFQYPPSRVWLYGALASVGAVLTIYGMAQRLSGSEQLFGTVPLRYGGQFFASFVNRNNAAGFLNVCLASSLGGMVLMGRSLNRTQQRSGQLVFGGLAVLNLAGIVATYSRGGWLSAGAGLVVAALLAWHWNRRVVVAGLIVSLLGVSGFIGWLGFQEELGSRMETLRNPAAAMGVRWQHWADMWPAVKDRPLLGSGLGTYKYVNRPYHRQEAIAWFWNADNQYVEQLVEMGAAGLLIVVLGGGAVAWALFRLRRDPDRGDLLIAGTVLLIALGLQSATDFGVTLLAVALPAFLILNLVLTAARSRSGADSLSDEYDGPPRWGLSVAVCLLLGLTTFWFRPAAAAVAFREKLPINFQRFQALSPAEVEELLAESGALLATSPEDAELLWAAAQLHIYRFRQEWSGELARNAGAENSESFWHRSRMEALHQVSNFAAGIGEAADLRGNPLVVADLVPARELGLRSLGHSDWLPGVHRQLAVLDFLDPSGRVPGWLARSAELDAGEPDRLQADAVVAFQAQRDELALACSRRLLRLAPAAWPRVMAACRLVLDDRTVVERLLETPEELVRFAHETSDPSAYDCARERLREFEGKTLASGPAGWQSWVSSQTSDLSGDRDAAIRHMKTAVSENPDRMEWRLQLADWLLEGRQFAAAEAELQIAIRQQPGRAEIENKLRAAIRGRLRHPARQSQ